MIDTSTKGTEIRSTDGSRFNRFSRHGRFAAKITSSREVVENGRPLKRINPSRVTRAVTGSLTYVARHKNVNVNRRILGSLRFKILRGAGS